MLVLRGKMIIVYSDNYCKITNRTCDRGSVTECPERKFNLEVPCKNFTHKDDIEEER